MDYSCPQFLNVSTRIEVRYWCKNSRLVEANIPRIETDAPEELETSTWLYR